jgi:hypothetical protein
MGCLRVIDRIDVAMLDVAAEILIVADQQGSARSASLAKIR